MGSRDHRVERRPGTAPDLAVSPVAGALNREWRRDYEGGAVGAPVRWKTDVRLAGFDRAVEALATVEDGSTAPARSEETLHALAEHAARGDAVAGRVLVQYLLPSLVRVSLWHFGGEQRSRPERLDDLLAGAWEVIGNGVQLRSRPVRIALLRAIEYRALGRPVRQARRRAAREALLDPLDLEQVADRRGRPAPAVRNTGEEVIDVLAEAIRTGLRLDDARLLGALFVGGASCREMAVIDGVTDRSVRYRRAAALRRLVALAA